VVTDISTDFSAFIFKGSKGEGRLLVGVHNLEVEDATIL
jgi:hypothetical protein